jgi:hypothetical protein
VDLETGVKDAHQPYKTLSKYRRIDSGAKYSPCFGMLCVSDRLGMSLAIMLTKMVLSKLGIRWRFWRGGNIVSLGCKEILSRFSCLFGVYIAV